MAARHRNGRPCGPADPCCARAPGGQLRRLPGSRWADSRRASGSACPGQSNCHRAVGVAVVVAVAAVAAPTTKPDAFKALRRARSNLGLVMTPSRREAVEHSMIERPPGECVAAGALEVPPWIPLTPLQVVDLDKFKGETPRARRTIEGVMRAGREQHGSAVFNLMQFPVVTKINALLTKRP